MVQLRPGGSPLNENLSWLAAEGGHLELLQWARANGGAWDEQTCSCAAGKGHLELLQWARANECPWNEQTCSCAAAGGHLELLQWARANAYPWDVETCSCAAAGGHLGLLQWARANGCPWDEQTCSCASGGGHLELLQWARANGCTWHEQTCTAAARAGHFDVLQWARANECPWDEQTCTGARHGVTALEAQGHNGNSEGGMRARSVMDMLAEEEEEHQLREAFGGHTSLGHIHWQEQQGREAEARAAAERAAEAAAAAAAAAAASGGQRGIGAGAAAGGGRSKGGGLTGTDRLVRRGGARGPWGLITGAVDVDLFEAAKASDMEACEAALAAGADLNFNRHNGGSLLAWKGWRLKIGGIEWGLQEWDAPIGVVPVTGDTILMIALKCDMQKLAAWVVARPEYKPEVKNADSKTAEDVARDYGRSHFLTGGEAGTPAGGAAQESTPGALVKQAPATSAAAANAAAPPRLPAREHMRVFSEGSTTAQMDHALLRAKDAQIAVPALLRAKDAQTVVLALLRAKDVQIAELQAALARATLDRQKSESEALDLRTRIVILESSLKSTKPAWMKKSTSLAA
ncbi:hypothetical protein JKP88DRAFT_353151 [Tribonema minus]|uniref:Uncharacterized protein n=1 Tax=Tribonema minus TaxID=303371 RepID=A0A835ZF57_9STRA|nr:hypothetical protein JKP88DRAFT_353151 [Tribonema minus]